MQSQKLQKREMQWVWETSQKEKIFAHYLMDHYKPPFPVDRWWETFKGIDQTSMQNLVHFNVRLGVFK